MTQKADFFFTLFYASTVTALHFTGHVGGGDYFICLGIAMLINFCARER